MRDTQGFREQIGRIEELVQNIEGAADPAARATAKELLQSVMDLHSAAIERILEIVAKTGEPGASIIRSLGADELVSSLLVLYDLHPEDFATRVRRGVTKAGQLLARRGASVHVLGIRDSAVHLQIDMNGHTCGSTAAELQSIVQNCVFDAAPDTAEVHIEPPPNQSSSSFVPLASLQLNSESEPARVLSRP